MELNRLSAPLQAAGVASALLVLTLFLPWYGTEVEGFAEVGSFTAWQSFALIDLLLLLLAGAALSVLAAAAGRRDLPLPAATLVASLGIAAFVLVAFRFLDLPFDGVERRYGLFVALLASIGMAVAGWVAMRDAGESFGDARADVSRGIDQARTGAAEAIEGDARGLEEMTREELYEEAQDRGIDGRSEMDKQELIEAIRRS